jgi:lysophospholipase L1-like esterase
LNGESLRYVALGDSYTIGTSVEPVERWPDQLVARLAGATPTLELVANLGVNGYTSDDVLEREVPELDSLRPAFVTLLVGVNDVVQGVPPATYRANVARTLDLLLERLPPPRILTVETPDYTVTPQGSAYGEPVKQSVAIARNNAIFEAVARDRGIHYVGGIFTISRAAAVDRGLVAEDGLHPSGRQYTAWVELIAPVVEELLSLR